MQILRNRRYILWPLVVLLCFAQLQAKTHDWNVSPYLSLEPNFMLAQAKFITSGSTNELYLSRKTAPGIGIAFGLQLENDRIFVNAQTQFLLLRNAVGIDFESSGFNSFSEIKYTDDRYGFDYATSQGININGGFKLFNHGKSALYLSAGGHFDFTIMYSESNSVQVNTSRSGTGEFTFVYYEEITNYPRVMIGGDLSAMYRFALGRSSVFAGAHYSWTPGQDVEASFRSFNGLPMQNTGTINFNRSYLGVKVGIFLGK